MAEVKREAEWHKFSSVRLADGQRGFEIAAGLNDYGDGPARTVGRVFGISDRDFAIAVAGPAMLNALRGVEHWLDVSEEEFEEMRPADRASHQKQLDAIRAAVASALGEAK
ncbi:hypothetical protein WG907_04555 [Sphingobium sp. AN558]|uniref:hypothetical protein n=1 Tax=Sphingobium sp. AN558 TaxID=3133442 RepID=UPI0030BE52B9